MTSVCTAQLSPVQTPKKLKWYKGNTHTHTQNSDGDSSPEAVTRWYRDNGYNFLFITDHEFVTPVEPLNQGFGKPGEFLVISGQEITDHLNKKPYHINALGIGTMVMPQKGKTIPENLQLNIDSVRNAGGVPQINHPNFGWALTSDDIKQVKNSSLIEIYSGHPLVNNLGGGDSPGTEEIWDSLLTAGIRIFGVGSDDSHYFKKLGDRSLPTPGQAWVMVRAEDLTPELILKALDKGDFYFSTGVVLDEIIVNARFLTINIKTEKWSKYTIKFVGSGGRILKTAASSPARYEFKGNESYVRAKIIESNGKMAWTQPVFIERKR